MILKSLAVLGASGTAGFRKDEAQSRARARLKFVECVLRALDSSLCKAVHRFRQICFLSMRRKRGCYLLIRRDSRGLSRKYRVGRAFGAVGGAVDRKMMCEVRGYGVGRI